MYTLNWRYNFSLSSMKFIVRTFYFFEKVFLSRGMNEIFERGLIEGNALKKLVDNIFLNRLG